MSGLEALTPAQIRFNIRSVRDPGGDDDPDELATGTEIEISTRPFGVGPHQRWTSRILGREAGETTMRLRDSMVGGPFLRRIHTHRFVADGDEMIIEDCVEYELPFSPLSSLAGVFGGVGFEGVFRAQHAKTEQLLEEQ